MADLETLIAEARAIVRRYGDQITELINALERAQQERAELVDALTDIYRVTGRGDGHGTPRETANCAISAFTSLEADYSELERELEAAQARVAELEGGSGLLR